MSGWTPLFPNPARGCCKGSDWGLGPTHVRRGALLALPPEIGPGELDQRRLIPAPPRDPKIIPLGKGELEQTCLISFFKNNYSLIM